MVRLRLGDLRTPKAWRPIAFGPFLLSAIVLSAATIGCAAHPPMQQTPKVPITPVFSPEDVATVMGFWGQEDRFSYGPPPDTAQKGLYRVRLTVAGSVWLWKYARSRGASKAPPTIDAKPADAPASWQAWIDAKVAWDRQRAQTQADRNNAAVLGHSVSAESPGLGDILAGKPGPCPPDLAALVGDPPTFAEACVVHQYQVRFDDVTLSYADHVKMRQKYAYYRFSEGVNSEGVAVKTMPSDRLDHLFRMAQVDPHAAKVMRAVSVLEGGFDSINTYDTGYVSVGFIQFASLKEGAGSLGQMLLTYKQTNPTEFARDFHQFGLDVAPDGHLAVLDPDTGVEVQGAEANERIILDKRLIAVFGRAGLRSDAFMAAQIASAKGQFYPDQDLVSVTLGGRPTSAKVADLIHSEAGLATLMDRKVNTGGLGSLATVVQEVADEHRCRTINDIPKWEAEIVQLMKYRKSYLDDPTLTQPNPVPPTDLTSRHLGRSGRKKRNGKLATCAPPLE